MMNLRKLLRWFSAPRIQKTHGRAWFPLECGWACEACGMVANGLSGTGCLVCGSQRVFSVELLVQRVVTPIRASIAEHREERDRKITLPYIEPGSIKKVENTAAYLTGPGLDNWSPKYARNKKP